MKHGDYGNLLFFYKIADNLGKAAHERLPNISVRNGMPLRRSCDALKHIFDALQKFAPGPRQLAFVPTVCLFQVQLRFRFDIQR